MCGAPATCQSPLCSHCGARLATVACPSCFGLIFEDSKFCPHCGVKPERREEENATGSQCPRCKGVALVEVDLGAARVMECQRCCGLWIDVATLAVICSDREKQAAVLAGIPSPEPSTDYCLDSVRYDPCPKCGVLMNRVNFARNSGVIVDICKPHGVWFDQDELRRIVEFIRAGGMEIAREREIEKLQEEERRRRASGGARGLMSPAGEEVGRGWNQTMDTGSLILDVLWWIAKALMKH